jgi:hypothetical protein
MENTFDEDPGFDSDVKMEDMHLSTSAKIATKV